MKNYNTNKTEWECTKCVGSVLCKIRNLKLG